MKVVGWLAVLSFGFMCLNSIIYLGYKFSARGELDPSDAAVAIFGLMAAWISRVMYRVFIGNHKSSS